MRRSNLLRPDQMSQAVAALAGSPAYSSLRLGPTASHVRIGIESAEVHSETICWRGLPPGSHHVKLLSSFASSAPSRLAIPLMARRMTALDLLCWSAIAGNVTQNCFFVPSSCICFDLNLFVSKFLLIIVFMWSSASFGSTLGLVWGMEYHRGERIRHGCSVLRERRIGRRLEKPPLERGRLRLMIERESGLCASSPYWTILRAKVVWKGSHVQFIVWVAGKHFLRHPERLAQQNE
jgi:hypothetical protein